MRIGICGEQAGLLCRESCEQRIRRGTGGSNHAREHGRTAGMSRLMMTTGCRLFVGVGLSAGKKSAARGAEGRREKAKNEEEGTKTREQALFAGAHDFIVRGVGWEGIVICRSEVSAMCGEFKRDLVHLSELVNMCPESGGQGVATRRAGHPGGVTR